MKYILQVIALLLSLNAFSQDEDLVYSDHVYTDNIKSVQFHPEGYPLLMPVLFLGDALPLPLVLKFDDVSGDDIKDYTYTVVHCNADWKPSRLLPIEYVDGYGEERIQNFDYSFKAKSIYTHYWFSLPNEDMSFSKSGNYLLKVYEEEEEKRLVITRRFVVVERQIQIFARPARVAAVHLDNTHQEVDFTVKHEGFEIRNPRQELFATVLQNGRWDTAIAGIPPFISGGTEQRFDYQGKIVFPAGKEFRYVDLRGLKYKDPRLTEVTIDHDGYEARIEMDRKRGGGAHFEWRDINGNFIIENTDESGRIAFSRDSSDAFGFTSTGAKSFVNNLESEYVDVLFTLYSPGEMYGEDLYIFGGLSDWELKPEFKMVYNPAIYAYVGKVKLKQGYYDYIYAAVSHETGKADFEVTEGNAYETENEYTILVYYREFGSRYDRLIGIETISSRY